MRKIEQAIVDKLRSKDEGSFVLSRNHEGVARDTVRVKDGMAEYFLYGAELACLDYERGGALSLGTNYKGRGAFSATTKARINAIARAFGPPGVYQEHFVWHWQDGEPYTGERYFPFN